MMPTKQLWHITESMMCTKCLWSWYIPWVSKLQEEFRSQKQRLLKLSWTWVFCLSRKGIISTGYITESMTCTKELWSINSTTQQVTECILSTKAKAGRTFIAISVLIKYKRMVDKRHYGVIWFCNKWMPVIAQNTFCIQNKVHYTCRTICYM